VGKILIGIFIALGVFAFLCVLCIIIMIIEHVLSRRKEEVKAELDTEFAAWDPEQQDK